MGRAPGGIKVSLDALALRLERCHVIRLCRVLLLVIAAQVHLAPDLADPDVRLPPAQVGRQSELISHDIMAEQILRVK